MKKLAKVSKAMVQYRAIQRRYKLACELRTLLVQDLNQVWAKISIKEKEEIMRGEKALESKAPSPTVMT